MPGQTEASEKDLREPVVSARPSERYEDFGDERLKHLEFLQAVIARLGGNGFLVKGSAVTVAAAFFGFAVDRNSWPLALASVAAILGFWGLDGYLLRSERLFRELYAHVRNGDEAVLPFYMAATSPEFVSLATRSSSSYRRAVQRPVHLWFYGGLSVAAILIAIAIGVADGAVVPSSPSPTATPQSFSSPSQTAAPVATSQPTSS